MKHKARVVSPMQAHTSNRIEVYPVKEPDAIGQFAMRLVVELSQCAYCEDSDPALVAGYAVSLAQATFDEIERRGLVINLPDLEEINRETSGEPDPSLN